MTDEPSDEEAPPSEVSRSEVHLVNVSATQTTPVEAQAAQRDVVSVKGGIRENDVLVVKEGANSSGDWAASSDEREDGLHPTKEEKREKTKQKKTKEGTRKKGEGENVDREKKAKGKTAKKGKDREKGVVKTLTSETKGRETEGKKSKCEKKAEKKGDERERFEIKERTKLGKKEKTAKHEKNGGAERSDEEAEFEESEEEEKIVEDKMESAGWKRTGKDKSVEDKKSKGGKKGKEVAKNDDKKIKKGGKKSKKTSSTVADDHPEGVDADSQRSDTMEFFKRDESFRGFGAGPSAITGVIRLTISPATQEALGCVIGVHVTSESPWVFVDRTLIEDNLFLHSESSDFLPIKDDFSETKLSQLLIGYDGHTDEENRFHICLTEDAQEAVLRMLEERKQEQQRQLENALEKTPRPWVSLGSEEDVQLFTIKNERPFMQVVVETTIDKICQPVSFTDRDVESARDGYFHFPKREEPPDQISCYRLEAGVQVKNPSKNAATQTAPSIPYNAWTQYEFEVDTDKPIQDEEVLRDLAEFLGRVEAQVIEVLSYNEILDNYRDDYGKLVTNDKDTNVSNKEYYTEFVSFTDMKHCQGKSISAVAFHPIFTGIVAIAYVDPGNVDVARTEKIDEIAYDVYTTHRVLVWSVNDAFKPKLILESPREVHSLEFAPHKEELLVGGCSNGQIVIWDIGGKIERVEKEVQLTPEQISHNIAMMNMMDWMKHTIQIQYLRPVAVSSIEHSHPDVVFQVRFLNPSWEMLKTGRFEPVTEGRYTTQLLSASFDGTVLVWNLDPVTNPVVAISVRSRKRKTARRPEGIKSEASPYAIFHRTLAPFLKIELPTINERIGPMFRSMDIGIPCVEYDKDEDEWAKLTPKQKESPASRFKFMPRLMEPTSIPQRMEEFWIGTPFGQFSSMDWKNADPRGSTALLEHLNFSIIHSCNIHGGPINKVERSPFFEDLVLSIDWGMFAIWNVKMKDRPFMWRRPAGEKRYTSGSWSIHSPTAFRMTCSDGSVEIWDLARRTDTYVLQQSVSGKSVNVLVTHPRPLPSNIVGLADSTGCFRLFFIPAGYQEEDTSQRDDFLKMFDREKERSEAMKAWVLEWNEKTAEERKLKKLYEEEQEAKKRAEFEESMKSLAEPEEELIIVEKSKSLTWGDRNRLQRIEERRENMLVMMAQRKKIDREDLERKRAPLLAAQEAIHMKKQKQKEQSRNKNALFRETLSRMFPLVSEKPPPKPTDCEILAAELEERDEIFLRAYRELEQDVMAYIKPTSIVGDFNWKRVMQEGRKRREVLDSQLYHQYEYRQRHEERQKNRRLHRESQLRYEDEKRKARRTLESTTSSQILLSFPDRVRLRDGASSSRTGTTGTLRSIKSAHTRSTHSVNTAKSGQRSAQSVRTMKSAASSLLSMQSPSGEPLSKTALGHQATMEGQSVQSVRPE